MREVPTRLVLSVVFLFINHANSAFNNQTITTSLPLTSSMDLNITYTPSRLGEVKFSLQVKQPESSRGLMEQAQKLMPMKTSSPMLSYVLVPALTLAGIVPWVVPGIQIAAGFVQLINQMAFMAGLTGLVRSYIFDYKPDEHVVYVNHGYGDQGHSPQHLKPY